MTAAAIAFVALFALMFCGMPIGFAMGSVGAIGFALFVGWQPTTAMVGQIVTDNVFNYSFSLLPLFVLMGNLITNARLSDDLYAAATAVLGRLRGGLAMSTILACGGFGAVCGSSMATAATMARVAMPQMRRYGYSDGLAAASIAAGGSLGILVPPSIILVIYGFMTDTDIGQLFIAGVLPSLVAIALYMAAVWVSAAIDPKGAPPGDRLTLREKLIALRGVAGVCGLFTVIMVGIYGGIFTPSEAAGIGATGALFIAMVRRTLTWRDLTTTLVETARTSSMMFIVLFGALIFSNFITITGAPGVLADAMQRVELSPIVVILLMCAVYIVLGCMLESLSMMLLTIPIFYPIVQALGFDMVWFGILIVVVIELSLITPPIGMNVFVLKAVVPDIPIAKVFRALVPFLAADVIRLLLFIFVPSIVLFLPSLMR